MNFFKKLRKSDVTVLDTAGPSAETVASSSGRSSSGLRRSGVIFPSNYYHDSETKLFEEAPISSTTHFPKVQNSSRSEKVSMTGSTVVAFHSEVLERDQSYHNLHERENGNQDQEPALGPHSSNSPSQEMKPDDSKVNRLMTLYAVIIRGEKTEVKKLLTSYPDLLEAPDNFGRTPLMYCVLADRIECAKLLLKMKCKLDQVDKAGRSALHLAAHKASYKFLELLHERGGNIEMKDNDGQTPLHLTTRNRHARCLDFLLKRITPGMVDVKDSQNRTALHWSAAFNNADYVKQLIKHNSNIAMPDAEGKTPLHWAANTHDPSAVATLKTILDHAPSVLNWQDYQGRTALHFAVAHENVPAVEFLLSLKQEACEVDRLDNSFRTPLHWAAQLGNKKIVKLLLDVNAKNSITDSNGATALLYASLNNHSEVILEMMQHDLSIVEQADIEGRSALMWAAGKGATDVIQTFLKLYDPNATINKTLTNEASEFLKKTCESINQNSKLKQAVDINRTDNKGNTALHMAAWNGHAHSSEFLLLNHVKLDLQNNMHHTPLFGACEKGHVNVVKHLLDYGASISLTDNEGRSPLHWAALGGHAEVCDLLITKGLDPDLRDSYQRSPLHCAAFGGFINCMNLLLENGANVDLQDKEGLSALHWAAQSGHLDATKLLFQCSAFANLMEFTEERLTPLDHALLNGREEVAQYLIEQGALSSETIRDIAAARIQACYRGYMMRKAFLRRKNLLMKHEQLRSKRGGKRKPHNADVPLNCVAEELVPKSPNGDSAFADSIYSGEDSHQEYSEYLPFPAHTIKSVNTAVARHEGPTPKSVSGDEGSDSSMVHGQQNEDTSSAVPIPAIKVTKLEQIPFEEETAPANVTNRDNQLNQTDTVTSESVNMDKASHEEEGTRTSPKRPLSAKSRTSSENSDQNTDELKSTAAQDLPQDDAAVAKNVTFEVHPPASSSKCQSPQAKGPQVENTNTEIKTDTPALQEQRSSDYLLSELSSDDLLITDGHLPVDVTLNGESRSLSLQRVVEEQNDVTPSPDEIEVAKEKANEIAPDPMPTASNHESAASTSMSGQGHKQESELGMSRDPETVSVESDSNEKNVTSPPEAKALDAIIKEPPVHSEANVTFNTVAVQADVSSPFQILSDGEDDVHTLPSTGDPGKPARAADDETRSTRQSKSENLLSKLATASSSKPKRKKKREKKKRKSETLAPADEPAPGDFLGGRPEKIETQVVRGLAYKSEYEPPDEFSDLEPAFALPNAPGLRLSEYIESLMSLSAPERKALAALQRNRKQAFKRANAAASVIQKAWRRYAAITGKVPPPKKAKSKKKSRPATVPAKPVKKPEPPRESAPPDGSKTAAAVKASPRYKVTRQDKAATPVGDKEADGGSVRSLKSPDTPQRVPNFSVRVTHKSEGRPRTSDAQKSKSTSESASDLDFLPSSSVNSVQGAKPVLRKSRRLRPKTEHTGRRIVHSSLPMSNHFDPNQSRLEQLWKVYGQTLALHDLYYPTERGQCRSRFRTVPAPSTRPKTSRVVPTYTRKDNDDLQFVPRINLYDPVTAVQLNSSAAEWKSSSVKTRLKRTSSLRKSSKEPDVKPSRSSRKLNWKKSEVAAMPVQWQQIYCDLKRVPGRRIDPAVPTRFSYNMRSSNF